MTPNATRLLANHRAGKMLDQAEVIELSEALRTDVRARGLTPPRATRDPIADLESVVVLFDASATFAPPPPPPPPRATAPAAPSPRTAPPAVAGQPTLEWAAKRPGENLTAWALRLKAAGVSGRSHDPVFRCCMPLRFT